MTAESNFSEILKKTIVQLGILPFLVVLSFIVFSLSSSNFLTIDNLLNVFRQSVYLTIVSLGQMVALITGGFDLSVGTILAITSVSGALIMSGLYESMPESVWSVILIGSLGGILGGTLVGIVNGIGVAYFSVSPFMMTLGTTSIGFGVALYLTGGVPVYGMPQEFGDAFGFGSWLGIPTPIYFVILITAVLYIVLYHTKFGRYLYAVGGNIKAANLSGINTKKTLFWTYVLCAFFAAVAGMLLTARLDTGEANIGASMPLESIAACIIAGVSLRGGVGRLENVVLGSLFIGLIQNGMNLARIESYLQMVVLGCLLILAVVADQFRIKLTHAMRKA